MKDRAFLLNRVNQLRARYLETYCDELTNDEVSRYLVSLVADRKRGELAIFDNLPTKELVETLDALTMREEPAAPDEIPAENTEPIVAEATKKPRGRPKGWRKER